MYSGFSYPEYLGAALGTCSLHGSLAVFESGGLYSLNLPFVTALYTVSDYHVILCLYLVLLITGEKLFTICFLYFIAQA